MRNSLQLRMGRELVQWATFAANGDRNGWIAAALDRAVRRGLPATLPVELLRAAASNKEKFIIRLDDGMREAIQSQADDLGIDVSEWVRMAICAAVAPHL